MYLSYSIKKTSKVKEWINKGIIGQNKENSSKVLKKKIWNGNGQIPKSSVCDVDPNKF